MKYSIPYYAFQLYFVCFLLKFNDRHYILSVIVPKSRERQKGSAAKEADIRYGKWHTP